MLTMSAPQKAIEHLLASRMHTRPDISTGYGETLASQPWSRTSLTVWIATIYVLSGCKFTYKLIDFETVPSGKYPCRNSIDGLLLLEV
jgi:hypothetical protein